MDEKRFAVLLTDAQEVLLMACNPQKELFGIARQAIGCDWVELVEAEPLAKQGMLLLIDEEGKLKPGAAFINCIASHLYGAEEHGDPIKLLRMGIDVSEEHFYTSALATAEFIRSQNPKASAYVPALALHRNFRIACLKGFIGWIKADRERWAVLDWVYQLLSMLQCCIMRQLI